MNNQEAVLEQVWAHMKAKHGYIQSNIFSFAQALKEVQPEISYAEYKAILKKLASDKGRSYDWVTLPEAFEWISASFVRSFNPSKVLVPFATGLEYDLFENVENVEYYFYNKDVEKATRLFSDIYTVAQLPDEGTYDLILAALPLDSIYSRTFSWDIVERCSNLLSDNGYCIFTFVRSIAFSSSLRWLSKLEQSGLYCAAMIDMPVGSYAPISNVDSEIVVFSKKKTEKRFTALLSEARFSDAIVDNFLNQHVSEKVPKLGVYIDPTQGCFSVYNNEIRLQKRNQSLAKAYNGSLVKINEIGTVHPAKKNKDFSDSANAVFVPKLGNSPAVTHVSDFNIKPQNYFQVLVDQEKVLPRYLAFFLNTEEGLKTREMNYSGSTIKSFNSELLANLAFPCPSLDLQAEYLKTYDQLEVLRVEIETLKDKLQKTPASYKNIKKEIKDINNTGDKFTQWIETLPYPLATILKRYSVAEDLRTRQEILFYFFEAYSIFVATLLSAALNKTVVDCSGLKDVDPSYFEKASFGNWVRMDRALSNLFLGYMNSTKEEQKQAALACFRTSDEFMVKYLCSKNVCNILDNASNYRNSWKGHSGITSDSLYGEHVGILDSMLHKLHESIKDLYERVRLIRPLSLSFSNNVFSNKIEVLTGSNPVFTRDTFISLTPLDSTKLYLQILDTGEMLELPPYFILKNSPADVKNACYFYSRVEKGNTRYVSYHFDGRPEDLENGVIAYDHIRQLLSD